MKNTTICSKSWTDVNINFKKRSMGHCCASVYHDLPDNLTPDFFDNNPGIQERRRDTLAGIQHPDCKSCWRDVNNGITPFKAWVNTWDDFSQVKPDEPQVDYIEIEIDNTCDLSCLYCSAEHSSKIAQEEGKLIHNKLKESDFEIYKQWFQKTVNNSKKPMTIAFLGGEPTASKLFYEMVDFIESLNAKNLKINVTTNANSKDRLFTKFLNTIENSSAEWVIHISNESYKDSSHLIRYGLDWDRFESNVRLYASQKNVSVILFDVAMNNLSLPTFPEYVEWVCNTMQDYDKKFTILGSAVDRPRELDIAILPVSYKKYMQQAINILKERNPKNCIKHKSIFEFLGSLESRIGSNYQEDYQDILAAFLEQKQKYKKTDKLMRLINP